MNLPLPAPPQVRPLDADALRSWTLPTVDGDADKEARGRVLVVAGSREIPGAACLAAQAALRAGAGKVQVATVAAIALPMALALPEARVIGLHETSSGGIEPAAAARQLRDAVRPPDVLLVGPGLVDEAAAAELARLLRMAFPGVPMVVDAAAMDALAGSTPWPADAGPTLLTPHAGEMAHLLGHAREQVLANASDTALDAARRWGTLVALKGATTWLALPDGALWRHDAGAVGLSTAGSGDVLAGLIAGLAGRGASLAQAAAWGVVVHAQCGHALAGRTGRLGYLARELADEAPAILERLAG